MNKLFPTIICLLSCLLTIDNLNAQKKQDISIREINYGLYSVVSESVKSEDSPSGRHGVITNYSLRKKTDTIDAVLGETFGVEFSVVSKKKKPVMLKKVWTFSAAMVNPNGKTYSNLTRTTETNINEDTITTYELEEDFEVVLGKWTLQMYFEEQLIYERHFFIVKR